MKKHIKIPIVIIILIIVAFFIPVPYLVFMPGTAEDLNDFVDVHDAGYENEGVFYLVTVAQQRATLASVIYGLVNPFIDVMHIRQVIPPGIDEEDYRRILERWMEESKLLAKLIALRRSGEPVEIKSEGIGVRAFVEDSPSEEKLEVDDVILRVDGEEVYFADQLLALVQDREVGDPVELTVRRDSEVFIVNIPTVPHAEDPERPVIGVYITALGDWDLVLPVEIEIKTGNISGPSAGVMFVLEIMNQLIPGDLAGGRKIAGTGTIDYYENVGEIGGVKQKVAAAEKAGADYFIIPEGNYNEVIIPENMKIVPVKNLQDVMNFLTEINITSSYDIRFSKAVSSVLFLPV